MHDRPAHYAGEKKTLGFSHRLASFHAAWKRPGSVREGGGSFTPRFDTIKIFETVNIYMKHPLHWTKHQLSQAHLEVRCRIVFCGLAARQRL
jgi:hypothetical protein